MVGAMLREADRRMDTSGDEFERTALAGAGPALCMPNLFMVAFPFLPNRISSTHAIT